MTWRFSHVLAGGRGSGRLAPGPGQCHAGAPQRGGRRTQQRTHEPVLRSAVTVPGLDVVHPHVVQGRGFYGAYSRFGHTDKPLRAIAELGLYVGIAPLAA